MALALTITPTWRSRRMRAGSRACPDRGGAGRLRYSLTTDAELPVRADCAAQRLRGRAKRQSGHADHPGRERRARRQYDDRWKLQRRRDLGADQQQHDREQFQSLLSDRAELPVYPAAGARALDQRYAPPASVSSSECGASERYDARDCLEHNLKRARCILGSGCGVAPSRDREEEGLKNALAQAQSNQRLVAHGAAAEVDVVEANSQIAVFQDNVFSALQSVARLQNQLKSLTLSDPSDPIWRANLVPTSAALQLPSAPALNELLGAALKNRPEFAQLRDQRQSADINLAFAREELLPQIDLQLGYTTNGFAGLPTNPSVNPFLGILGGQVTAINKVGWKPGRPAAGSTDPLRHRAESLDPGLPQRRRRPIVEQSARQQVSGLHRPSGDRFSFA